MPRFGSVWLDAVCRVPKPASVVMMLLIRCGSISLSAFRRSGSKSCAARAEVPLAKVLAEARLTAALAVAVPATRGAATAVAADADRKVRRLGLLLRGTPLFSMP